MAAASKQHPIKARITTQLRADPKSNQWRIAIFSHGDKRWGLWAIVGPSRMKARGLDEHGLEEYYPVDGGLPDATPR